MFLSQGGTWTGGTAAAAMSSSLGEDVLCAAINNNNRAYGASIDFQEHMEEVLQPQLQVHTSL